MSRNLLTLRIKSSEPPRAILENDRQQSRERVREDEANKNANGEDYGAL